MKLIKNLGSRINKTGRKQSWAEFLCEIPECGKIVERLLGNGLKQKSCGCNLGKGLKNNYKHGETKTRLYGVWRNMKYRCYNPNCEAFKYYGGRGIIVCPEWANDYTKFRDWSLSNGYQKGLFIDRINSDGNYEPSNCRFLTIEESNRNKRR